MPKQSTSSSKRPASAGKRKRRNWSVKKKLKVLKFYAEHGSTATCKHFKVGTSQLTDWKQELEGQESTSGTDKQKVSMSIRVLAKKVKKAVINRMKASDDASDADLTTLMLVNAILNEG